MKWTIAILCLAVAGCSPDKSDEAAMIRGADALGWSGKHKIAGHSFRDLPGTMGGWQVAPAGNLTAFMPRRVFEELAELPKDARTPKPIGDVIINIGEAGQPDVAWRGLQPLEPTGEYAGLKRYVSRAPGVVRPGDTLILPAPYEGRIDCMADVLPTGSTGCDVVLQSKGLRHTFTITAEQVRTWRAYVDGYLRVIDKLEA